MTSLFEILGILLNVARWIVLVHIIMSWLINFQVLNLRQPLVAQVWNGLSGLLEPVYGRVRQFLPRLQGIDLAPLVVLLLILFLETILRNNAAYFY